MRETADDLLRLQRTLDESRSHAGAHLRKAFGESTATADDVVRALAGVFEMHLAVVTGDGAPMVAPLDGLLLHGRITFGLPAGSVRSRLLRRERRVSASYHTEAASFIVHGVAHELEPGGAEAAEFEDLVKEVYVKIYGPGWLTWFESQRDDSQPGFAASIEPRRLYVKCATLAA